MKRVLVLTYYWPPSGGSGVQRWLKFVKYLREFGWEPVVYTAEGGEMPAIDHSLEKEVPEGLEVIRRPIWEPYSLYKKVMRIPPGTTISAGFASDRKQSGFVDRTGKWLRGNLFIPDARRFWIRPSVRYLKKWLKNNHVDAIVSTGPPHSMHLIACGVAEKTGIPWLADFRDPWTDIDFYKDLHLTRWADNYHHRLERKVLTYADTVVCVSPGWAKGLEGKCPCKVSVVSNGYDEADRVVDENASKGEEFILLHAGTLGPDRNVSAFWKVLGKVAKESPAMRAKLKIRFIGKTDISALEDIDKAGLSGFVDKTNYMPHKEVILEMASASVLLLFINNTPGAAGTLTGKVYEYLMCNRPVFGVGPNDKNAASLLKETGAGTMLEYGDEQGMETEILRLFNLFSQGALVSRSEGIEQYGRRYLTGEMAKHLDEMVAGTAPQ